MPLNIPVPIDKNFTLGIYQFFKEILRRAVDGSQDPVYIATGDVKIATAGKGLILSNRSGTKFYRILIDDDGVISADPL